jgi:hypothetical protein
MESGVGAEPLRRVFAAGGAPATRACPAADELWAGAARALPGTELEALLDHVAACGPCSDAWKIAVDVQREHALGQERGGVVPFRPRRWWTPVAWAAGLAASVVLIIQLAVPRTPAPSPLPDAGPLRGDQPGAPRALVNEGETLPRGACVLRWTDAGPGAQYFVRVLDEQMAVVARGDWLERAEFTVPVDALARFTSADRLFWQVEARAADGTRRTSPLYSLRVR